MSEDSMHCQECVAGHVQCQAKAKRVGQSNGRLPGVPDISLLSPELQQQWDSEANLYLGAIKVKPKSDIKAVWQCNKCPAGQPHVWTTMVHHRTQGTQCPYCSNRLVCLHNSLATVAPDVAQHWNHSKNEKAPEQVLAGSRFRAEWKCPTCKWEWQAPISRRVSRKAFCPKCSRAQRVLQPQPTFAEARPAELAEWDYELNDAEGFHPERITLGSAKLVHWICSCCPRGQPHRWTARLPDRIGLNSGCPVCAGRYPCVCNSLQSLAPSVAAEFDVDKNGFAPSEITAGSGKVVWWRNERRGSWRQAVDVRTDKRLPRNQQVQLLCNLQLKTMASNCLNATKVSPSLTRVVMARQLHLKSPLHAW